MKILKELPFYGNTEDNTHCFQAGLKMILGYFLPERNFTFEELDEISQKKEGLWTWPLAAVVWMQENGFEVVDMEVFDYERFISEGGGYLIEEFGWELGEAQIKNSDIENEIELSKKLIEKVNIEKRIPNREDIFSLMEDGYVVAVNINSKALNKKSGYAGHFVVIKGYDNEGFILNDPGLPGMENRKVLFELFEKAWAYPDNKSKNITAFRRIIQENEQ